METLQDLVESLNQFGNKPAISWQEQDQVKKITFFELYHQIVCFSKGFISMGLHKGDRVALLSDNNPQWLAISLGINYVGLIDVPRGLDSSDGEIKYILEHSEAKIAIVQNKKMYENIRNTLPKTVEDVYSIERIGDVKHISSITCLEYSNSIPLLNRDDIASIIYTSGTTGGIKGAELSHNNLIGTVEAALTESPYIKTAIVVGQDRKKLGVLIVPHAEILHDYCTTQGLSSPQLKDMMKETLVQRLYQAEIQRHVNQNHRFRDFVSIADFRIVSKQFEVGRELTPTLKLKRRFITEMYRKEIDDMYRKIHKK